MQYIVVVLSLFWMLNASSAAALNQYGVVNSMPELKAIIAKVEDAPLRTRLNTFLHSCTAKDWATCLLTRYDIYNQHMVIQVYDGDDETYVMKGKNSTVNTQVVRDIEMAMNMPATYGIFQGLIDDPWVPGANVAFFESMNMQDAGATASVSLALKGFQQQRKISADIETGFTDDRAEWIRRMVIYFALTKNTKAVETGLGYLRPYATDLPSVTVFNNTIAAVKELKGVW